MLRRIATFVVGAVALVGCAGGSSGSDGATEATAGGAGSDATSELLAFSAPIVGGGTLDVGTSFAGEPLALWFWAPG
jgi:hypothetical protein